MRRAPRRFSEEPADREAFKASFDAEYSRFAGLYDLVVRYTPLWRRWLNAALPQVVGPRVLEVSCGTGYLMTRLAERFDAHGVDLNREMVAMTRRNLTRAGLEAEVRQGDVEALPYDDSSFDSVVNTMAFTGYPDGDRAMGELTRVLKRSGRLVMIDVNYPRDGNALGVALTRAWARGGDLIREMGPLFARQGLEVEDHPVGGFGSVHLYVCRKSTP